MPVPATAPTAPTNLQVNPAANGQSATVTWSPPASNGGSPVTGYTVTRTGGTPVDLGVVGTHTWTGLTPGSTYTFTVAAKNAVGTGPAASQSVTLPATPSAPTGLVVTPAANGQSATVTWSPPASNGGSPVTGYTVTRTGGTPVDLGVVGTHTWTGLTPGSTYTFTVAAKNAVGTGPAASTVGHPAGDSVGTDRPGRHPGRQRPVRHRHLDSPGLQRRQRRSPATPSPRTGGTPVDLGTGWHPHVDRLTPGSTYTFTVAAKNAVGTGPAASDTVAMPVPATAPSVPTNLQVNPAANGQSATVTWTAPASDGGSRGHRLHRRPHRRLARGPGHPHQDLDRPHPRLDLHLHRRRQERRRHRTRRLRLGRHAGPADRAQRPDQPPGQPSRQRPVRHRHLVAPSFQRRQPGHRLHRHPHRRHPRRPRRRRHPHLDRPHPRFDLHLHRRRQERRRHRTHRLRHGRHAGPRDRAQRPDQPPGQPSRERPVGHGDVDSSASDGGSAVTGYTVDRTGASPEDQVTLTKTWTGLTPGTTYTFTVAAKNAVGTGPAGLRLGGHAGPADRAQRPDQPPGQPSRQRPVRHRHLVAPASNGGSPVTGYTLTRTGGTPVDLGVVGTHTWTGLTPGTTYTFTVAAKNAVGTGPAASQSVALPVPPTAPSAPTNLQSSPQPPTASPPPSPGRPRLPTAAARSPATPSPAPAALARGPQRRRAPTPGPASPPAPPTPSPSPPRTRSAPDPPPPTRSPCRRLRRRRPAWSSHPAANGQSATVTWTAPASNGGSASPATPSPAPAATPVDLGAVGTHTWTGLTPGATYTFTVAATNAVGTGPAASQSATLPAAPSAPTGLVVTPAANGQSATVTWTAPASDGGSPVTGYTVTRTGGTPVNLGVAGTHTWTGLTPGTTYTFTAAAKNAVGPGTQASVSASLPTTPGAPVIGKAKSGKAGGKKTAKISWSAPATTGGSALTGYKVLVFKKGKLVKTFSVAAGVMSYTAKLKAGKYQFAVVALNAAGAGLQSGLSKKATAQ